MKSKNTNYNVIPELVSEEDMEEQFEDFHASINSEYE